MANQGNDMKGTRPDPKVADPNKDVVATAGQQSGNQQSGSQQSGQQGGMQSGQQQQGGQQQGSRQSGQQGGGQHASGGTPALDDLDSKNRSESARDASQAFSQQNEQGGGNR
jgi:hypothetical protein